MTPVLPAGFRQSARAGEEKTGDSKSASNTAAIKSATRRLMRASLCRTGERRGRRTANDGGLEVDKVVVSAVARVFGKLSLRQRYRLLAAAKNAGDGNRLRTVCGRRSVRAGYAG